MAVTAAAFAPMAFFLSAVYSESLYLALSVGLFWSARQGRWALVGLLGALAERHPQRGRGAARAGADALPVRPAARSPARTLDPLLAATAPPAARATACAPTCSGSLCCPPAWCSTGSAWPSAGATPSRRSTRQDDWGRHFAGPYVGVWDGLKAAFEGARQLLSIQRGTCTSGGRGRPVVAASHNLILFAFLLVAIPLWWASCAGFRSPTAPTLAALALPLSYPVSSQPLMSLPRFLLVLFPLFIAGGDWLADHPRAVRPMLAGSAVLMVLFLAQFATWHWVA